MKKYFKKTTTHTATHQKIREDLCYFTAKHLGSTLPHMRKLRTDTTINDATLVSFAPGKVNIIQETKVFLVAKHNGKMVTDSTSTFSLDLGRNNPMYIKTNRNNPLFRTNLPERNKTQNRSYSTNAHNTEPVVQTWSEYLYPYFTSDYYYAGQIVTAAAVITVAAVTYYYVAPAVISYYYNNSNTTAETITNTKNVIIEKTSKIKDLPKTEIEQELTAQLNLLKREHDPSSTQFSEIKKNIGSTVYNYRGNIQNTATYNEDLVNNTIQLLGKTHSHQTYYWLQNNKLESNETLNATKNIFLNCQNTRTEQLAKDEILQLLTETAVFNIADQIQSKPSIIEQYIIVIDQVAESLPPTYQFLPTLLRYGYNISACYWAIEYQKFFPIKGTHTENE